MARRRWDPSTLALAVLTGLYFVILLRTAWVCDDAYITLRTVDNFIAGHGLRWNVIERVQAYTHPFWMLILSVAGFATREAFFTTIMVSISVAGSAVVLFAWRIAQTRSAAILGLIILIFSRAFIDYSTSGLENPLSHLLVMIFMLIYLKPEQTRRTLLGLCLTTALLMLSRLDLLLIALPPLVHAFYRARLPRRAYAAALLGFAPLLLWEFFSLVYYGFPLPNTAYAKLNTGLPAYALFEQGVWYFVFSAKNDPITVVAILAMLVLAIMRRDSSHRMVAAGLLLYFIYILKIGGDFMGGRFFSVPLLCAVAVLGRFDWQARRHLARIAWASAIIIGSLSLCPPVISGRDYHGCGRAEIDAHGVADERAYFYETTGLLRASEYSAMPAHKWAEGGRIARQGDRHGIWAEMNVGFFGYHAGPNEHIVDIFALADPLLARLPALTFVSFRAENYPQDPNWRIGHFLRKVPEGYVESLASTENRLRDPHLGAFYAKLKLITQGPLFTGARWRTIWRMNTGQYNHLIDREACRNPLRLRAEKAANHCFLMRDRLLCSHNGVRVTLPELCRAATISIGLDATDRYLLVLYRTGTILGTGTYRSPPPKDAPQTGPIRCDIAIPVSAQRSGYDEIGIYPLRGDGHYEIGPLAIGECAERPVSP